MTPDVAAQNFVRNISAAVRSQDLGHRSADISLRVDKSAVNVEDVDRKRRDHDALSRFLRPAASIPGRRRGGSGLITCCAPSPVEEGGGGVGMASSVPPSINWRTSLPSSTSRSSSALA